jgi:hypothetical protein
MAGDAVAIGVALILGLLTLRAVLIVIAGFIS